MGEPVHEPTHFTAQCGVIARLSGHDRDALDPAEEEALAVAMSYVTEQLPLLLSQRVKAENREPQDIAQEAMTRFLRAVGAGRVDPDHSPAGYLLTIAMNVVRDDIRTATPPTVVLTEGTPVPLTDIDHVTQLLDRIASADSVRRGLERAYENRDRMVLDVVRAWLDLAYQLGEAPSSRVVAEEVGVSKSTVANVLSRFKGYLAEKTSDD